MNTTMNQMKFPRLLRTTISRIRTGLSEKLKLKFQLKKQNTILVAIVHAKWAVQFANNLDPTVIEPYRKQQRQLRQPKLQDQKE